MHRTPGAVSPNRQTRLEALARVGTPVPANYDEYGPDGRPVWMTPDEKAVDERAHELECRQAEADAADPDERRFWRMHADRARREAIGYERVASPLRSSARPATRSRGAGRPGARGGSRRSSAKSGDSGEDGEHGSPAAARPCACGCGQPAPPRGKGATRAACRKRLERERNRAAAALVFTACGSIDTDEPIDPDQTARARLEAWSRRQAATRALTFRWDRPAEKQQRLLADIADLNGKLDRFDVSRGRLVAGRLTSDLRTYYFGNSPDCRVGAVIA